jgi:hypothetical protein
LVRILHKSVIKLAIVAFTPLGLIMQLMSNELHAFVGQVMDLSANVPGTGISSCGLAGAASPRQHALEDLKIIKIKEIDKDGVLANGKSKHWHKFDIIAQKP